MSKTCNFCGSVNDDSATVCAVCGDNLSAPVVPQQPGIPQQPTVPQQENIPQQQTAAAKAPQKAKISVSDIIKNIDMNKVKKYWPFAAGAVAVIAIVIILICSLTGVKAKTSKFFKAFKNEKYDKIVDMVDYDYIIKLYKLNNTEYDEDELRKLCETEFEDYYEALDDAFSDEFEDGYKLKYDVMRNKKLDEDEIVDFISNAFGVSKEDAEDYEDENIRMVKICCIGKSGSEYELSTDTLYFIKDGGWKLLYFI